MTTSIWNVEEDEVTEEENGNADVLFALPVDRRVSRTKLSRPFVLEQHLPAIGGLVPIAWTQVPPARLGNMFTSLSLRRHVALII